MRNIGILMAYGEVINSILAISSCVMRELIVLSMDVNTFRLIKSK